VNLWGNFNELFAVENVWDSKGVESDIQYTWSTRGVIRTTRQAIRQKLLRYSPRKDLTLIRKSRQKYQSYSLDLVA
jgi:hypothetical protein